MIIEFFPQQTEPSPFSVDVFLLNSIKKQKSTKRKQKCK